MHVTLYVYGAQAELDQARAKLEAEKADVGAVPTPSLALYYHTMP